MRWTMERIKGQEAIQSHIQGAHLSDLAQLLADTMKDQPFELVVYQALAIHTQRQIEKTKEPVAECTRRWQT